MALVAASGDGNAPSTAANRVNNGATVANAGNVGSDGPVTNSYSITDMTAIGDGGDGTLGSKVVEIGGSGASTTDRVGVMPPLGPGSTLGFNPSTTEWIVKGGNVTETINGSANRTFVGANADHDGQAFIRDNIHERLFSYALGSGNGTFDVLAVPSTENTPGYTKGGDAGSKRFYVAPSGAGDVTATDDAAVPTRSVPGELTYHYGDLDGPTTDEYKASNVFES